MDYSALGEKLRDTANPFRAGWAWIVARFIVALVGSAPLLLYIGFENLTGASGGNPIGSGLLAMAAFGLSQLCLLVAIIWMGYGIFRILCSPTS